MQIANRILRKPKCYVKSNTFSFNLLFILVNSTIINPVTQARCLEIVLDQGLSAQVNIKINWGHTPRILI